jgi:hypothetical protein
MEEANPELDALAMSEDISGYGCKNVHAMGPETCRQPARVGVQTNPHLLRPTEADLPRRSTSGQVDS